MQAGGSGHMTTSTLSSLSITFGLHVRAETGKSPPTEKGPRAEGRVSEYRRHPPSEKECNIYFTISLLSSVELGTYAYTYTYIPKD
jgi:hypothetical protein